MQTEIKYTRLVPKTLLHNRRFLLLWFASIFSSFAFPMYLLAEQWYIVKTLQLPNHLGWIMMATALPRVLLMLVGGVVADQISSSKVLFATSLARAFLLVGMIALLWVGELNLYWLAYFAVFFGVLDAFFWPASESMIPQIVSSDQITRANALLQMNNQLSLIIGPAFAGAIIYATSVGGVLLICAIVLCMASLLAQQIYTPRTSQVADGEPAWQRLREGIEYTKQSSFLLVLMSMVLIVNCLVAGPVSVGIPLIVDQVLQGNSLELSFLQSAFGLGTLLGAACIGLLNIQKRRGLMLCVFLLVQGVFVILLSHITTTWQGVLLLFTVGMGTTFVNIPLISLIQHQVPMEKMGRVMSLVMTASVGLLPVSFALCSGLLTLGVAINQILFVCGMGVIGYVLLVLWRGKPVRDLD